MTRARFYTRLLCAVFGHQYRPYFLNAKFDVCERCEHCRRVIG